jgi:hypothetical protein
MCKQKVHEDSMGHYCPGCDETLEPDKRPDHDLITAVLAYLDRRTPQNRLRMRKRAEELSLTDWRNVWAGLHARLCDRSASRIGACAGP